MANSENEVTVFSPTGFDGAAVFTIDVEDYFMSPETIPFEAWPSFPSRIETGMERCLKLLQEHRVKATFFFVGWLAERYPQIVEWTLEQGHEIGTHTYTHHFVNTLSQEQFTQSLQKSLRILRDIAGKNAVVGHRAPAFSLERAKPWQFEALKQNGIQYDSSINPHGTYLYGDAEAPRHPYMLHGLLELPPASIECLGRRWPVGGGGTLRILPSLYQTWARKRYIREGFPPVIYMHPWEFLQKHPPLNLPIKQQWIHHWGLRSVESKLRKLFDQYRCVPMGEYAAAIQTTNEANSKR
ncbi:MAG: polysaccharide deacetylase family protein [Candidatus Hinthialibacter antarcticus]|nr:polysaccharide deacetylase family protein [Candidatus Hinthialibacter antarcticus]